MRGEDGQPGHRALKLLADEWVVALMRDLTRRPLRSGELHDRRPDLPRAGSMRRLRELSASGVVEREAGSRPHARYVLTDSGRELLRIAEVALRWERGRLLQGERPDRPRALGLAADQGVRAIVRALANEPLAFGELKRRMPGLAQAPLARRLRRLALGGVLVDRGGHAGHPRYALTPDGRRLGPLVLLAVRWESRWPRGTDRAPSCDLAGLVHLIAPLVRTPPGMTGVCAIRVEDPASHASGVHLAVGAGRVSALALAPVDPPQASATAKPLAWCEAMAAGDLRRIAMQGDRALVAALLAGLSSALQM